MIAASDPDMLIAELALGGLLIVFCWRVIVWVRDAPNTPDPWDAELNKELSAPEIEQACHHCSTPQKNDAWFCPHCGSAVGPYNNMMPYVWIFSQGEVFRNGAQGSVRRNPVTIIGYLIYSSFNYAFLAPIYWIGLFRNMARLENESSDQPPSGNQLP